jgi:F0F1-type ATP synthase delta subunit
MKYNYKIYARALVSALDEAQDLAQKEKIIKNFLSLIQKNKDTRQLKKIIDFASKIIYKKEGRQRIILETARPQNNLKNLFQKFFNEKDIIEEKINPNILAGIRIVINDEKELDFSFKKRLELLN